MKLKHLLECNLLDNAAEIEEICEASTKEESLEAKLNTISEDWSDLPLTFGNYKSRGPVILKAADTFEIVEKLEESQLALAAMATNRYAAPFREEVCICTIYAVCVCRHVHDISFSRCEAGSKLDRQAQHCRRSHRNVAHCTEHVDVYGSRVYRR